MSVGGREREGMERCWNRDGEEMGEQKRKLERERDKEVKMKIQLKYEGNNSRVKERWKNTNGR